MAAKDRRERIKQATRQGILDASRAIARTEGWPAVTIRKVADVVEYSPSIVYEYFSSKDDILLSLLHQGFAMLTEMMQREAETTGDPYTRLERLMLVYIQFADANPELYQVMHGFAGVSINPQERGQAAYPTCVIVEDALASWAKSAGVVIPDLRESAELVWAILHGLVSLAMVESLSDSKRVQQMAHTALDLILAGWRAQT